MTNKLIRKHVSFKSADVLNKFLKFKKDGGFSSFSHMLIYSTLDKMKRFYGGSSLEIKHLEEILDDHHNSIYKHIELISERIELISIRINKEGNTSKISQVIKDILTLLLKRDMDHSKLLSKCIKYDTKTKNYALSLLIDSGIIGSYNKNKKR